MEKVFKRKAKKLIKISLSNGDIIKPTADHPFYLQGHWVLAGKLAIGDKLLKSDGSKTEITAIEEQFDEVVVYNFRVKDNHTKLQSRVCASRIVFFLSKVIQNKNCLPLIAF